MSGALLRIADHIETAVRWIGRRAGWLAPLLMLLIVADVVLRRALGTSSSKIQELEWHLHGALFLLAMGFAYLEGAHVRIEVLHERLWPRSKAWIEFLGLALTLLPYCAAILWFGWDYVLRAVLSGEASPSPTGLPMRWIIKSVLLAGFIILALAGFARFLKAGIYLFGPKALSERTGFAHGEAAESHIEEDRI
ncbi:MAG: TRAP transporter small permease subunit [Alphaproteobacteria bacterium]|nr:MAG: TRAP transporter small permease subunit [Alphaproteobacteria bacterium]